MTLQELVTVTLQEGGVTYSLWLGDMKGTRHYAMSVRKEYEEIHSLHNLDTYILRQYIIKHIDYLSEDNIALGIWVYDGQVYLDSIYLFDKTIYQLEFIKRLGREYHQIAAWDLELNKEIKF